MAELGHNLNCGVYLDFDMRTLGLRSRRFLGRRGLRPEWPYALPSGKKNRIRWPAGKRRTAAESVALSS